MQDKLIEAAQAFIDKLALVEPAINGAFGFQAIHGAHYSGPNYGKELAALKEAIAAVRAHDAGTDEGSRKARVQDAFDKIASANIVKICSLDEMESIVNRALDGEFDADLRVPPASHAAESAHGTDVIVTHPTQKELHQRATAIVERLRPKNCMDPTNDDWSELEFYLAAFKPKDAPQLDAEDPAEPVEDVPPEIADLMWDEKKYRGSHDIKGAISGINRYIIAAFNRARKGYVKLEDALDPPDDTECALADKGERQRWQDAVREAFKVRRAHLAPKPEPTLAEEIDKILLKHNIRTVTSENVVCNSAVSAELAALVDRRTK